MNAKPRRFLSDINDELSPEYKGGLRLSYDRKPGTLIFECEIVQPPSSAGRTIYVFFKDEDLTDALRALRDEAIRARSQPLEA